MIKNFIIALLALYSIGSTIVWLVAYAINQQQKEEELIECDYEMSEESTFKKLLAKEAECECLKENINTLNRENERLKAECALKDELIKKYSTNDDIKITFEQAECLCDFLEAEFINGIGSDKDVKDNEYVKGIRAVYDKLQEVCKDA